MPEQGWMRPRSPSTSTRKPEKLPYIEDENERLRVQPSEIDCRLEPLDDTATHWPVPCGEERFQFSPANLLRGDLRDIVIPTSCPAAGG